MPIHSAVQVSNAVDSYINVSLCFQLFFYFQMMFIFAVITHTRITYEEYEYPDWAIGIGWYLCILTLLPIPVYAITLICFEKGSLKQVSISPHKGVNVMLFNVASLLHRHQTGRLQSMHLYKKAELNLFFINSKIQQF